MRASLLATAFPALVFALTACGPSSEPTDTAEMPSAAPVEEAAMPAPEAPAPTQTAEAAPPPAAAPAPADDDPLADAIALRQGGMKLLSFANGPVGGMLRGTAPFDAATVQTATTRVAALAKMIPAMYATDTRASSVETEALPGVWEDKAAFDMKAMALVEAAEAAAAAAATGDQAATMAAAGQVGQACGSCHDDFRAE